MNKHLGKALSPETPDVSPVPPRCEWLFQKADVPDAEVVACVCWEYLREVPPEKYGPNGLPGYAERLLVGYRQHKVQRKFNDSFHRIPMQILAVVANNIDIASTLPPWQELESALRQQLNQPMARAWKPLIKMEVVATGSTSWGLTMPVPQESKVPRPLAEEQPEAYAFVIGELARRQSADQNQEASTVAAAGRQSADFEHVRVGLNDPRSWLIAYAANELACPLPFLVNWGEYTRKEIIAAFRDWVEKMHPGFAPAARTRGTKVRDLRGALRDLGALRIMRAMPADEFMMQHTAEYELFQQSAGDEKCLEKLPYVDITKLRTRAIRFFQAHFAAAPEMKPRSWQKRRTTKRTLAASTGDLPDFSVKNGVKSAR